MTPLSLPISNFLLDTVFREPVIPFRTSPPTKYPTQLNTSGHIHINFLALFRSHVLHTIYFNIKQKTTQMTQSFKASKNLTKLLDWIQELIQSVIAGQYTGPVTSNSDIYRLLHNQLIPSKVPLITCTHPIALRHCKISIIL